MLALGRPYPLGLCSFPFPTLGRSPREQHLVMKFREMSPLVLETIRRVASETPGANPKAASSGWPWVSAQPPGPLLPPGKAWVHLGLAPGLTCQLHVPVLGTEFPFHFKFPFHLVLADSSVGPKQS